MKTQDDNSEQATKNFYLHHSKRSSIEFFAQNRTKKSKFLNQFFSTLVNFWKLFDVVQITTEGLEIDISFNFRQ